jgi:hypothetical protein
VATLFKAENNAETTGKPPNDMQSPLGKIPKNARMTVPLRAFIHESIDSVRYQGSRVETHTLFNWPRENW